MTMPDQKQSNNRATRSYTRPIIAGTAIILALVVAWFAGDALSGALEPAPHYSLYVVNADGNGQKLLRNESEFDLWGPAWSPDGKHIAVSFVARFGDKGELYLLDSNGQNPTPLTHNGRNNYNPAWSHDGKQIAFFSQQGQEAETAELYVINADGTNERRLTQNQAQEYGATWSPDDRQIAFGSKMDGSWQIDVMDADGANQQPLAVRADGSAPVWSPDGQWLSITSERDGNANIYILAADGHDQRSVTNDPSIDSNSSWSPDGSQLAFWSDRTGTPNIFVMKRDGSQPINLTNNLDLYAENPSWSPDGKQIVFHAALLETGAPKLIRENLNWIFVGIVGVIALLIVVRLARRNRKVTNE
jgi:Tol biopolymer transport system component